MTQSHDEHEQKPQLKGRGRGRNRELGETRTQVNKKWEHIETKNSEKYKKNDSKEK